MDNYPPGWPSAGPARAYDNMLSIKLSIINHGTVSPPNETQVQKEEFVPMSPGLHDYNQRLEDGQVMDWDEDYVDNASKPISPGTSTVFRGPIFQEYDFFGVPAEENPQGAQVQVDEAMVPRAWERVYEPRREGMMYDEEGGQRYPFANPGHGQAAHAAQIGPEQLGMAQPVQIPELDELEEFGIDLSIGNYGGLSGRAVQPVQDFHEPPPSFGQHASNTNYQESEQDLQDDDVDMETTDNDPEDDSEDAYEEDDDYDYDEAPARANPAFAGRGNCDLCYGPGAPGHATKLDFNAVHVGQVARSGYQCQVCGRFLLRGMGDAHRQACGQKCAAKNAPPEQAQPSKQPHTPGRPQRTRANEVQQLVNNLTTKCQQCWELPAPGHQSKEDFRRVHQTNPDLRSTQCKGCQAYMLPGRFKIHVCPAAQNPGKA